MDLISRILTVLIGTILVDPGYVLSQGGVGISIGQGMGGDLMLNTPLLGMPGDGGLGLSNQHQLNTGMGGAGGGLDPAFLMNLFGTASAPIFFPSTFSAAPMMSSPVVYLPGSIGISDQHTAAASSSQTSVDQANKEPNYVLKNEAFTALGNVGHLVKVPVSTPGTSPSSVLLNQISASDSSSSNQYDSNVAKATVELPASSMNFLGNSANGNTVRITGEPIAMFNPGSGMASEMAVLQASLAGNAVDMSGFVPPPFAAANSNTKETALLENSQTNKPDISTILFQGPTQIKPDIAKILLQGPTQIHSNTRVSLNRTPDRATRSGSASIHIPIEYSPNSRTETNSQNSLTRDKSVPHVMDLVTEGIYPFEGSSAARTATLDRKLKIVNDLENAIKASHSEPLHLETLPPLVTEPPRVTASLSTSSLNTLPVLPNRKPSFGNRKVSLTLSDTSSSQSESFPSTFNSKSNITLEKLTFETDSASINSFDSITEPKIALALPENTFDNQNQSFMASDLSNVKENTAKIYVDKPSVLSRKAKLTIKSPSETHTDLPQSGLRSEATSDTVLQDRRTSLRTNIPVDTQPMYSEQMDTPDVGTSSFLSDAPLVSVNDPNYTTVMGNVVGIMDSKDFHTADTTGIWNEPPSRASALNSRDTPADLTQDVLSGSNGGPITNMAGIHIPSQVSDAAIPTSFDARSAMNTLLNGGKNLKTRKFPSGSSLFSDNPESPTGSFVVGAGQPNATLMNSNVSPQSSIGGGLDLNSFGLDKSKGNTVMDILAKANAQAVDGKPTQNANSFAVDMSAFQPPAYKTPSRDSSSFNVKTPLTPVVSDPVRQNKGVNSNFEPARQQSTNNLLREQVNNNKINQKPTENQQPKQNSSINSRHNSPTQLAANPEPRVSNAVNQNVQRPSLVQEIVNVEPGWADSLFPMPRFAPDWRQTSLKTVQPEIINIDSKATDSLVNRPFDIQRPQTNPNGKQNSVVGSIFGENNLQLHSETPSTLLNRAQVSNGPTVDFMTSFLNNPNINVRPNIPAGQIVNNSPTLGRDAEAVDQFGVADIFTRQQQLDQNQWNNLLSLVPGKKTDIQPTQNNVQYETLPQTRNYITPDNTRSFNQAFQPDFLIPRNDASTSIRTMFEAPGATRLGGLNVNSGFDSGFSKTVNSVFTVPKRQEFVASNPSVSRKTTEAEAIMMPMFPSEGVPRNQVAAPDSGSTRAFDASIIDQGNQNVAGSSQQTSLFSEPRSFTVGNAITVGDRFSQGSSSSLNRGTGSSFNTDTTNLNQFGSTGMRLGQPMVTRNTASADQSKPLVTSNSQFMNRQDFTRPDTSSSTVNKAPVFKSTGTSDGRAVGVRNVASSPTQTSGNSIIPNLTACKYRADPTSTNHFIFEFRGFRHRFRCALGTAFDPATCECSTMVSGTGDCLEVHMDFNNGIVEDASVNKLPIGNENVEVTNKSTPLTGIALFGDNSKLTIWRYQNFDFRDHIMLKVQFRPGSGGGRFQPLISNCDATGGAPSVAIVYDSQVREVLLVLQTDNDTSKELRFPVNPNEWNDVTYIYDGQEFIGIVNGVRRYISRQDPHLIGIVGGEIKSLPTQGLIEIRDAAIVLGHCPRWGHYVGAMVDIQVYTCIPRDFRLE